MNDTTNMTAAELAAALRISERQVQRHAAAGMPFQPVGSRRKLYSLAECQAWLREHFKCQSRDSRTGAGTLLSASTANEYIAASRRMQLRVMPSALKQS